MQCGAVPVFVDIDRNSLNIKAELIEKTITQKTKAIFIAHSLGMPFDLKKVKEICEKNNLWLIEDCCDALGSKFNNEHVGTFGDLGTLSFYPAHHITMGEGAIFQTTHYLKKYLSLSETGKGLLLSSRKGKYLRKKISMEKGELPFGYDHKYIFSHRGFNLKITDMQAACGLAQLDKLKSFIQARKENYHYLKENLKDCLNEIYIPETHKDSDPSYFGFPIILKDNANFPETI